MKILIFSDVHWSRTSSIVTKKGNNFSKRLECLIKSMNWVNEEAVKNNCELMICAGDFFDKAQCNDEEVTALKKIEWNKLPCYFLCGNHESSVDDLRYSTLKMLDEDNHKVIDTMRTMNFDKFQLHFIPYTNDKEKMFIRTCLPEHDSSKKQIIISHNDLKGINYGFYVSEVGFEIQDIENNCELYLNGHLHNTTKITNKIYNLGSLTAHNFTNDSINYKYGCWILDTDSLEMTFIENPYGYRFYKIEIMTESELDKLDIIKEHAIVTVKCYEDLVFKVREALSLNMNVEEFRIISARDDIEVDDNKVNELRGVNHLEQFSNFTLDKLGDYPLVREELSEVLK